MGLYIKPKINVLSIYRGLQPQIYKHPSIPGQHSRHGEDVHGLACHGGNEISEINQAISEINQAIPPWFISDISEIDHGGMK